MNESDERKVKRIINDSLNIAEKHWLSGGYQLMFEGAEDRSGEVIKSDAQDEAISRIPGHKIVSAHETVVDEFIAMVVDMRGSTVVVN